MLSEASADKLVGVLQRLRDDGAVAHRVAAAARATGRPAKALPEHEIRRHLVSLLDAIIAGQTGTGQQIADSTRAADELAADRAAQGVPLEVLLDGVVSARTVMLESLIDEAQQVVEPQEVLTWLVGLDRAANLLQSRMVLAYRSSAQALSRSEKHAQVEALRELLNGGGAAWAEAAGLDLGGRYHCLVTNIATPQGARKVEPLLEAGTGLTGLVNGLVCRVSSRLPPAERLGDTLVVASPAVPVGELPAVHSLCREAVAISAATNSGGLRCLTRSALDVAVTARHDLGRLLARELLAGFDRQDETDRLLLTTMRTFLAEAGSTERTARALHVHPNTVRYRLRRFAELTKDSGVAQFPEGGIHDYVNWWWALTAWLGADDPTPTPRRGAHGG